MSAPGLATLSPPVVGGGCVRLPFLGWRLSLSPTQGAVPPAPPRSPLGRGAGAESPAPSQQSVGPSACGSPGVKPEPFGWHSHPVPVRSPRRPVGTAASDARLDPLRLCGRLVGRLPPSNLDAGQLPACSSTFLSDQKTRNFWKFAEISGKFVEIR